MIECNYKLVHVSFVRLFRMLVWNDVTIIYLLFSFCRVKKKEQIALEFFLMKPFLSLKFASKKISLEQFKN